MSLAPQQGRLLVASPELLDPNFQRTVVLLCRFHPDEGAIGLIMNRPTSLALGDVLPEEAKGRNEILWFGGPVECRSLFVLHTRRDLADSGGAIVDNLCMSSEPKTVRMLLGAEPPDPQGLHMRVCVGYAGWGAGQLEAELAEGAWLVTELPSLQFLAGCTATLWQELMMRKILLGDRQPAGTQWSLLN